MILIGSTAIRQHYPDFPRKPKDTDFILTPYEKEHMTKVNNIEFLENPIFSNKWKYQGNKTMYADDLCTLKASHLCWNINWEKHMWDLQFLLKKGCKIDPELFKELYEYWNVYHSKNKRSDLKMTKDDFFTNVVNYGTNEHDFIHTILNPIPIYTRVLKDSCEVELDENKFYELSHEDKLNFIREEVYVMAFERYSDLNYRSGYTKMLKKFIISHAPLFSVIFILENYIELEKCPYNYFKVLEEGLIKNRVTNE